MDEKAAYKIAEHCLEPIKNEIQSNKARLVLRKIKTQLIIAYRMGVVTDREKEMFREGFRKGG